jgi:hypothetical protein
MKKSVLSVLFLFWGVILLSFVFKSFKSHENHIKTEYNEQKGKYEYKTPIDWSEDKNLSNEKKAYFDHLAE